MKKILKRLLGALLVICVLLNVIAYFHAYKFTHFTPGEAKRTEDYKHPSTSTKLKALFFGVDNPRPENTLFPSQKFETVKIKSNVMLEAWAIKTDSFPVGTVIIFHGYRGSKDKMLDRSDEFLKMGFNTLLVDFMGSGGSEGNSTTIGVKEAEEVKACYDYLRGKGENRIYLFGTSMGAVSIMKAMNDYDLRPDAVILECPFGSMYKTVCARFHIMGVPTFPMAGLLMFWGGIQNGFWAFSHNPIEYAKAIKRPTLLLWGEKDDRVSKEEIDQIFRNLRERKILCTFPLCGHEDYLPKYREQWVRDLDSLWSIMAYY